MTIPKKFILDALRLRGLHERADFVDRQLPDEIDPDRNTGLFDTLQLNRAELIAAAAAAKPVSR